MATIYKSKKYRYRIVEITLNNGDKQYRLEYSPAKWTVLWIAVNIISLATSAWIEKYHATSYDKVSDKMKSSIECDNEEEGMKIKCEKVL